MAKAHNILQEDLQRLHEWATKWKMSFNVNKCKVMHIGYDNPNHQYNLNGEILSSTTEEKDLGIVIDNELKFAKHIKSIVGKANRMIGLIKISFGTLDDEMFFNLYNTLIRPLLEYCVQAWSPYLDKDITLLENVQKRATRLVGRLKGMSYYQRLVELKLTSLKERRVRGDMILTYRLVNGLEGVDYQNFFSLLQTGHNTRGHSMKLTRTNLNRNVRSNFFSRRVIPRWNALSEYEISAPSTSVFKVRYDQMEDSRRRARTRGNYV